MSRTIVTRQEEVRKLLNQKNNYSFGKLKRHFSFSTDYELMMFLLAFLNIELKNFNFESNVSSNNYLLKLIKYFNYSLGKIDIDSEIEIVDIISKMNDTLMLIVGKNNVTKCKSSTDNCMENISLLDNISKGLEDAIQNMKRFINMDYDDSVLYDNDLLKVFKEIIFELKNNEYLRILIDKYPDLIYMRENDKYIFSTILDNYFNILLNKNDYFEKIYFDKLIDLFLKYDNLGSFHSLKDIFYSRASKVVENLELIDYSDERKQNVLATIEERIHKTMVDDVDFLLVSKKRDYYKNIDFDTLRPLLGEDDNYIREDLTDRFVITIDSNEAKMLEQAISIEKKGDKYLLTLYVTDVVKAISENKDFDKLAYNHAINNPPKKYVFNYEIALKKLSLKASKIMPVIAYQFTIDKDMNCYDVGFKKAIINVDKNIKYSDLSNINNCNDCRLKDTVNNLLELTFSNITLNDELRDNSLDMINMIINGFATAEIANLCKNRNLPLIYLRTDFRNNYYLHKNSPEFLNFKEQFDDMYVSDIINTIGNDGIYEEDNFAISLFSPVRKVSALINQMLVCIYFINQDDKLDACTRNYLESQLDKIADNINEVSRKINMNKMQNGLIKKKVLGEV